MAWLAAVPPARWALVVAPAFAGALVFAGELAGLGGGLLRAGAELRDDDELELRTGVDKEGSSCDVLILMKV